MHKNPPALQEYAREMRHEATDAEHWLWQRLRDRRLLGIKFRRQVPIGHYIADFVCKERRLVVEIDGSQHQGQQGYDEHRTAFLEQQGYRVVRYWNNEVLAQGEAVLENLIRVLEGAESRRGGVMISPSPPRQASAKWTPAGYAPCRDGSSIK